MVLDVSEVAENDFEKGWQGGKKFVQQVVQAMYNRVQQYNSQKEWEDEDKVQREINARELYRDIRVMARTGGLGV